MLREGVLNFSKGEIAEELIARVDVPSYNAAVKQARNVIILKYGGLQKRPGTRLVAKAFDSPDGVRLLPFQFSLTQAYALEFGQGYLRPLALGGLVLEQPLTITAVTKAVNAQVTAAYHGFSAGVDQVYFNSVSGMIELNGLTGNVLSVIDANNFTVDIDTTSFSTFTGDNGGIVNVGPPPPPPPPPPVPPPPPPPPPPNVGGNGGYTDGGGVYRSGGPHGVLP